MKRVPGYGSALLSVLGLCLVVTPVGAHPPTAPYDTTVFAPIEPGIGFAVTLEKTAEGLTAPMAAVVAPGERGRLYVVEQAGKLVAVDLATGTKTPFLDLSAHLVPLGVEGPGSYDERGFLGAAFHPNYRRNGKLYTWTSEPNGGTPTFPTTLPAGVSANHQNVLAEWVANDPGNPAAGVKLDSRRELMRIDWPQFNHDAGDLLFGRDGLLYFGMGDGGAGDDEDGEPFAGVSTVGHGPTGNAQNLGNPLGKIHRIDVDGRNSKNGQYGIPRGNPFVSREGALPEIFAFGFRNPWRMSFDRRSGRLFVGDIGQNDVEEVTLVVRGGNHGWPLKEGTLCFEGRGVMPGIATRTCPATLPADLVDPIAQYDTHHEGHSVIGGYVYRGREIPALRGRYVFGEWSRLFSFPNGPDNFGRLLYLEERRFPGRDLRTIREFQGLPDEATRLGLTNPAQPPAFFQQTIAVAALAEDARGELYVLANSTGRPAGDRGVILKIVGATPGPRMPPPAVDPEDPDDGDEPGDGHTHE